MQRTAGKLVCARVLAAAAIEPQGAGAWEGAFGAEVAGHAVTIRVAVVMTTPGTHIVLRTESGGGGDSFDALGMPSDDVVTLRAILSAGAGVVVLAAPKPEQREALSRATAEEIGLEARFVAVVRSLRGTALTNTVDLIADGGSSIHDAVAAAKLLRPDAVIIDLGDESEAAGLAFEMAAHAHLVVLVADGNDAVAVVTGLVESLGEVVVAGALNAVVVASGDAGAPNAAAHIVTDDVRSAILAGAS
jgi:hypothetical protein